MRDDRSAERINVQLAALRAKTEFSLAQLKSLRPQQSSRAVDRLESALRVYLDAVGKEFQEDPGGMPRPEFMDDGFGWETMPIFAIAEELGKLNDENFESRRRALSQSVKNLQNDIWETLLTALVLGAIIAGTSVFRISSLEKESAAHQRASQQAEVRLRHLSQQLVSSQEQERKALSRELHDEIGQLLTALRMELGNSGAGARAREGRRSDPHLDQAKKLAESTLADDARYCDGTAAGDVGRAGAGAGAGMAGAGVFASLSIRPFNSKWTGICATCRIRTALICIGSCRRG